jgi:hypothetical protein
MVLSLGSIGLQYSFAQSLGEQIGDTIGRALDEIGEPANESIDRLTTDGILSCDFVNFCSNPVEMEKNFSKSSIETSSDGISKLKQTMPGTHELIPDVTSNISLIATPDLPDNLAVKDFKNPVSQSLHKPVNSSQPMTNNASIDLTPVPNKTLVNVSNNSTLPSLNTSEITNSSQEPEILTSLTNVSQISWTNFTSDNGYSISYPQGWNLTSYKDEVYIESSQPDSDYYPKMSISVRYLDPSTLNSTISDLFWTKGISNEAIHSSLLNTKVLSNIGLKYYIDQDYIILEPTQEGTYLIDGKQASSFKVHNFGDSYENEHITMVNDDRIYSIEINSDYFPTSDMEIKQLNQIKDKILESIRWVNETKQNSIELELPKVDNNNVLNKESKDEVVLPNDVSGDSEIKKTITSSESGLNITSSTHFFNRDDFKVVGEVLNDGSNYLELVKIIITLYDSNNNVIGTELTYTNPSDIGPLQSAPFEIIIGQGDVSNVSAIKSYKLYSTALNDQTHSSPLPEITTKLNLSIPSSENIVPVISSIESQVLNEDEFAINATLSKSKGFGNSSKSYSVQILDFEVGSNSTICPENNCKYEIQDGRIGLLTAHQYVFSGTLKIITQDEEGKRSKLMYMHSILNIGEILEKNGIETEKLAGNFNIGPSISYEVANSSLTLNENNAKLSLFGKAI